MGGGLKDDRPQVLYLLTICFLLLLLLLKRLFLGFESGQLLLCDIEATRGSDVPAIR
jgi:hypothetical protein